jgi:hypothetical protein
LSLAAFVVSSYILRSEELKTFKNAFVK